MKGAFYLSNQTKLIIKNCQIRHNPHITRLRFLLTGKIFTPGQGMVPGVS